MSGAASGDCGLSGEPPGVPLSSGFDYRPVSEFPELALSDEARDRVLAKMDDVDRCLARAAVAARTAVIAGSSRSAVALRPSPDPDTPT